MDLRRGLITMLCAAILAACSTREDDTELQGLWRSEQNRNLIALKQNSAVDIDERKVLEEEFGKLSHYIDKDELFLIYSSSLEPKMLSDHYGPGLDLPLSGDDFILKFKILDVARTNRKFVLTLDSGKRRSELSLEMERNGKCYEVDNSPHGDYVSEVFCKVGDDDKPN